MSNDKTTLADVQPAGRVRLGDQALRTSDLRRNAHLLVLQEMRTRFTDAGSPSRTAALDAAIAALSAQSLPSDQTDAWAIKLARESAFAHSSEHAYLPQTREETNSWQPHEWVVAAIQTAMFGAGLQTRQQHSTKPAGHDECPVTGLPFYDNMEHPEHGLIAMYGGPLDVYSAPTLQDNDGELRRERYDLDADCWVEGGEPLGYFYREQQPDASPPAQQPAQVYLDGLDRALGETIGQRDRYHEVADDLAGHIARITGVDVGEHSSANCPWRNAIEAAEEYKPAQAVDLGPTLQAGVAEWMGQCFLPSLYSNMTERGDRLLEEVLELLQAHGYDKARVPTLVSYVFGRPVGEPAQEVGGVMVTLAGYCWVAGLDMHAAGDAELARINQPDVMAKIRAKQEAKNALHFDTPLPGGAASAQAVDLGAERMFYLQDTRQFVGNCPMWWGPNGSGYVTRLDEAGRYTEQEAIKQNRTRDTDVPWPCAEIDALARPTVDCQHMRPRAERLAELALVDSQAVR
ncbi:hypothetical protein [Stenotrophomonas maltophilia]|uniref:hypothetical protein n=1 Tax=Stenotrophomonas maltophilia TaxID=40324 RepID=UPI003D7F0AAF